MISVRTLIVLGNISPYRINEYFRRKFFILFPPPLLGEDQGGVSSGSKFIHRCLKTPS
jgi:hypothetical protein